jgi:Reverse transcriptase (RNA-dependent DNA polymerase)
MIILQFLRLNFALAVIFVLSFVLFASDAGGMVALGGWRGTACCASSGEGGRNSGLAGLQVSQLPASRDSTTSAAATSGSLLGLLVGLRRLFYSSCSLYRLRRLTPQPPIALLQSLSAAGILRFRGRRGGSHRRRDIPVAMGRRSDLIGLPRLTGRINRNISCRPNLIVVPIAAALTYNSTHQVTRPLPWSSPVLSSLSAPPSLLVINPISLAKPHALSSLQAELQSHAIDVAVVSETWFKSHHQSSIVNIDGYIAHRRDRKQRRGGGVAIYITCRVKSEPCSFDLEAHSDKFELLWVKTSVLSTACYIGALYHPPKPLYNVADLVTYITRCIDCIAAESPSAIIILAGDCNQLPDAALSALGLTCVVDQPTHMGHFLDRIYCSQPLYCNVKVVASAINTAHKMIIARTDDRFIVDNNKRRTTVRIVKRSANQDYGALHDLHTIDWSPIVSCPLTQPAFDAFYDVLNTVIHKHYPTRTVTITSRDPPFVTPHIKLMLRERNKLMRGGKTEKADAISSKIGAAIIANNNGRLSDIKIVGGGSGADIGEMWRRVNEVTGKGSRQCSSVNSDLTASNINTHYASVSFDPLYSPPLPKSSCGITHTPSDSWPSPWQVLRAIEQSKSNAVSFDTIPPWFSRLAAPFIAQPLAKLYSLSLAQSTVPTQWKTAIITPVPKVALPTNPADFRPISVLPLYSTILEKLIVHDHLYPAFAVSPFRDSLSNQFAFRPTGSTSAAIITLIHEVTTMLETEPYVHIISLDFSKAFDVARHHTLFSKLASLPIADHVYGWLLDFFNHRSHSTKFNSNVSPALGINASVVQGSALGPPLFILNSADLCGTTPGNVLCKYADDVTLIVPASNSASIPVELTNINLWCVANNQKLNISKSAELIVRRKRSHRSTLLLQATTPIPDPQPGIPRVTHLTLLGVELDETLSFAEHVSKTVSRASQTLYALKTLKSYGLSQASLDSVCKSTLVARLVYASPCWWGPLTAESKDRLQAVLNRANRWGLCQHSMGLGSLCERADASLFRSIISNPNHTLCPLLPPVKLQAHNLRPRSHGLEMTQRDSFTAFNFIRRMLFK